MPLPPGTIINPATGQIAGIPSQAGVFSFELRVRDALGTTRIVAEDIEIEAYTPMSAGAALAPMMATRAYTSSVAVLNGKPAITYAVIGGSLPAGLSLNAGSGALTGTPSTAGAYAFTIRATDSIGQHFDHTFSGTVAANLTLSYTLGSATVGLAYSRSPAVAGGTAPRTYAVAKLTATKPTIELVPGPIYGVLKDATVGAASVSVILNAQL